MFSNCDSNKNSTCGSFHGSYWRTAGGSVCPSTVCAAVPKQWLVCDDKSQPILQPWGAQALPSRSEPRRPLKGKVVTQGLAPQPPVHSSGSAQGRPDSHVVPSRETDTPQDPAGCGCEAPSAQAAHRRVWGRIQSSHHHLFQRSLPHAPPPAHTCRTVSQMAIGPGWALSHQDL